MAGNNVIAGTASLTVDGRTYRLRGGFKYNAALHSREGMVGMDGPHGFRETPVMPSISATLSDQDGLSLRDLSLMRDVTIVAVLANGKTVTGRNMATVETQEADATEATVEVKWQGAEVIEEVS